MNRTPYKPHFWSQVLLSMLAIFVLPVTQDNAYQHLSPNYQNTEQTQAQQIAPLFVKRQVQQPPQAKVKPFHLPIKSSIYQYNIIVAQVINIPPIRAGPALIS